MTDPGPDLIEQAWAHITEFPFLPTIAIFAWTHMPKRNRWNILLTSSPCGSLHQHLHIYADSFQIKARGSVNWRKECSQGLSTGTAMNPEEGSLIYISVSSLLGSFGPSPLPSGFLLCPFGRCLFFRGEGRVGRGWTQQRSSSLEPRHWVPMMGSNGYQQDTNLCSNPGLVTYKLLKEISGSCLIIIEKMV